MTDGYCVKYIVKPGGGITGCCNRFVKDYKGILPYCEEHR